MRSCGLWITTSVRTVSEAALRGMSLHTRVCFSVVSHLLPSVRSRAYRRCLMSVPTALAPTSAFVGIDVAKAKLDVVVHVGSSRVHRVLANQQDGFAALHAWLSSLAGSQCRLCLEATG